MDERCNNRQETRIKMVSAVISCALFLFHIHAIFYDHIQISICIGAHLFYYVIASTHQFSLFFSSLSLISLFTRFLFYRVLCVFFIFSIADRNKHKPFFVHPHLDLSFHFISLFVSLRMCVCGKLNLSLIQRTTLCDAFATISNWTLNKCAFFSRTQITLRKFMASACILFRWILLKKKSILDFFSGES